MEMLQHKWLNHHNDNDDNNNNSSSSNRVTRLGDYFSPAGRLLPLGSFF
jgi:hypothetical protein